MNGTILLLAGLVLLLLLVAYAFWRRGRDLRRTSGLPQGKVVYTDMERARPPEAPLRSERWGLVGKPDYILETADGLIPVEVKSTRLPRSGRPYPGHVLQLAAYCLLMEDIYGQAPPFGYIRYGDGQTVRIPYTEALRNEVVNTLKAMRAAERASDVPRSHASSWRCQRCGLAYVCGSQRLVA